MQTIESFRKELETKAQPAQEVRDHAGMKLGSAARQGDVYAHCIAKRPAAWDVENGEQSRQVALGATIGSRHCADGKVRVFWPKSKASAVEKCPIKLRLPSDAAKEACIGPIVECDEAWTLTHPEHAHHRFPAGVYLVTYQLDMRTMRAVRD